MIEDNPQKAPSPVALLIHHRARPGQRAALFSVWSRHMAPAIARNPEHLDYFYCYDSNDPDTVVAFQQYTSAEAASAFLEEPAYRMYLEESEGLIAAPPQVVTIQVMWAKNDLRGAWWK